MARKGIYKYYAEEGNKKDAELFGTESADVQEHTAEESVANKNINPEAIPDNEGWGTAADPEAIKKGLREIQGNNYGIMGDAAFTGYNALKSLSDFTLQTVPMAETILNPVGKYSGLYDYANTLFTTDVKGADFQKISKNQIEHPDIIRYLENYKQDHVLNEERVIDHLNNTLGLDVVNLTDLLSKYKGNKEVADAASHELKSLEEQYLTQNDWYEDEDFYYIKNFKEMEGVNVAWTKYGDIQMPNYGIFKFDNKGQGNMMRHSATNLKDSWNPVTSWIGEQGFGSKPSHEYDIELYGDPGAQNLGFGLGMLGGFFTPAGARQAGITALKTPGTWGKIKETVKLPWKGAKSVVPTTKKGAAIAGGIASVPVAGAFDVFGE
jgi:hypothetical protein